MTELAIATRGLTCLFGNLRAVDNVSLEVARGTIFGFLGPNGAGKTTTIRLLLGLLEPSAGSASVLGYDTRTQADLIRQRSGALLEHPGIYERLSAQDNLDFYGRVWRLPSGQRQERIKDLLAHLGLWERRNEVAGRWSRGMKQKLAVARALLHRPALIFLDEPTAGLDPLAAAALHDDLAALAASMGILLIVWIPILGMQLLPQDIQRRALDVLGRMDDRLVVPLLLLALIALDVIILSVARARFQRSRLILD